MAVRLPRYARNDGGVWMDLNAGDQWSPLHGVRAPDEGEFERKFLIAKVEMIMKNKKQGMFLCCINLEKN